MFVNRNRQNFEYLHSRKFRLRGYH